jgi:hypothetical protein
VDGFVAVGVLGGAAGGETAPRGRAGVWVAGGALPVAVDPLLSVALSEEPLGSDLPQEAANATRTATCATAAAARLGAGTDLSIGRSCKHASASRASRAILTAASGMSADRLHL